MNIKSKKLLRRLLIKRAPACCTLFGVSSSPMAAGRKCAVFLLVIFSVFSLSLQLFPREPITPIKVTSPPLIDGQLDEEVWGNSKGYSGFKSFSPGYGVPAKEKTLVYVSYDSDNLYFAFKCFDKSPEKIIATIRKRDTAASEDSVSIFIDSHNDGQNAYLFGINPLGVQLDGILNPNATVDKSQDFVWKSAGRKTTFGYSVEVKVPFKSIRFSSAKIVEMRVGFLRKISRYSEQYALPEWKPEGGSVIEQTESLLLKDINHKKLFEILPSFTFLNQRELENNEMKTHSDDKNLGLTTKFGLTSDMTIDMTVNPDFSHIESDAGEVDINLRDPIFYSEKRPFFLEGLEHFTFAACQSGYPISRIIHTRNIKEPSFGLKASGKIGKSNIINSLFTIDQFPRHDHAIDPGLQNDNYYGIFRFKHLLSKDSYVGTIYTAKESKNNFNRVAGLDSMIRLNGLLTINGFFLYSSEKAGATSTKNDGSAFGCVLNYEARKYYAGLSYHNLSKDFHLSTGWAPRNGISTYAGKIGRHLFLKSGFLKRITLRYSYDLTHHQRYDMSENTNYLCGDFFFSSSTSMSIAYSFSTEVYDGVLFDKNLLSFQCNSRVTKNLNLALQYQAGAFPHYSERLQGNLQRVTFAALFQPGEKFATECSVKWHIFHEKLSDEKIYDICIFHNKTTFQVNKYFSLRSILEYSSYYKRILSDFLLEFSYIPGTVIHLGYSPTFEKGYINGDPTYYHRYTEARSTLFFKASYLFRF
ncbi:MAG: carbohydrate binding family 9 domain-containing protein [bacterium]|nr:carbohydrate binding family 9 domain-containing protein [bacterium]